MDKINNALKCNICKSILDSPVILPCSHSICKNHTKQSPEIKCGKCGREHKVPKDGFLESESLVEIIAAQVHKINLGKVHEQAKKDAENLSLLIKQVDDTLADPSYKTNEDIDVLKNGVLLRREELKFKIDQETDKVMSKIDEYKVRFDNYLGCLEYQKRSNQLVEVKKSVQQTLEDCRRRLNQINVDDNLWKSITMETTSEYTRLANNLKDFENTLILGGWNDLKKQTEVFNYLNVENKYPTTISKCISNEESGSETSQSSEQDMLNEKQLPKRMNRTQKKSERERRKNERIKRSIKKFEEKSSN